MKNEYYYRSELENKMTDFIDENSDDSPFGWVSNSLQKLMADAAWSVLAASADLNEFLKREDQLKS